jgi:hypothetical protein
MPAATRLAGVAAAMLMLAGGLSAQGRGGRGGGAPPPPGPCDRTCLEGFVNQYLDALVAHNAFGLPFAQKVKFSENNQLLELGDGLWNVTTDIGTYKLFASDPQSGQVGFLGTVMENGRPVALALRLKVDNRKVSEIETFVYRAAGGPPPGGRGGRGGDAKAPPPPPPAPTGAAAMELMKPDPVLQEIVPQNQRVSRGELLKAANLYLDAIENGNADNDVFHPDCERIGNGTKITHNPALTMAGADWNPFTLGCAEQINSKMYSYIQVVYPRRFPIVDEERQLVFSFSTFQIPGDILSVQSPGHGTLKMTDANTQPGFLAVPELFRVKDGKIRRAENLVINLPYGTPDPFFNDDWRRTKK